MRDAPEVPRRPAVTVLGVYIAAVIVLGCAAVGIAVYPIVTVPPPWYTFVFAGLGLLASASAFKIPGVSAYVSASDTFFIASAMLGGPAPAMIALALDSVAMTWRRRYGVQRLLFNAAQSALSLGMATWIFELLGGSPLDHGSHIAQSIVPLIALTTTYFGLNSGLLAVAIGLQTNTPIAAVWKRFVPLASNFAAAASAAFCFVIVMRTGGMEAALAVVPLVFVLHLTLRAMTGRLSDAEQHIQTVDRLYLSTIETLATAIEAKDGVTSDHIRRVQKFAIGLAKALGISDEKTLKAINAAALLHDTGKLAVPEHILNKPGKLTPLEFEQMKLHVDVGADILSSIDFPYPVVPIVRAHHENWDGSGYPRALKGAEIPVGARILSVVDCYDALTSDRPYRPALSDEDALKIVLDRRGTMYDPEVVDTFVRVYKEIAGEAMEPVPHQDALAKIGRAVVLREPPAVNASEVRSEVPEDLLALVSLTRMASGDATFGDTAALANAYIERVLPNATCVFYVCDPSSGHLIARYAAGDHSSTIRGMTIPIGDRLSGWVASCRRTITNSDGALDLHDRGVQFKSALSTPLFNGREVIGVFTAYLAAPSGFTEDQSRLVEMMAPHLGRLLGTALEREQLQRGHQEARTVSSVTRDLRLVVSK